MDRGDASATACANSVRDKLQAQPLLLHMDVRHEDKLIGKYLTNMYLDYWYFFFVQFSLLDPFIGLKLPAYF